MQFAYGSAWKKSMGMLQHCPWVSAKLRFLLTFQSLRLTRWNSRPQLFLEDWGSTSCWEWRSLNYLWWLTFCSKGSPWGLKPPVTSPSSWSCLPDSQPLPEILGRRREREKKGQAHQKFNPPQEVQMQNLKMYHKQNKAPWSICLMFIQFWILFLANSLFSLWSERAGTACQAFEDFRTVHGRLYLKDGSNAKTYSLHPKSQVTNVHVQLMKNGGISIDFHMVHLASVHFLKEKHPGNCL